MRSVNTAIPLLSFVVLAFPARAEVTYSREISRIFQAKCAQCHRPNDIAPFELSTYAQAVQWAADIKRVVNEGLMPPWKPVEGHGSFRDSFGLTAEEKRQLLDWIDYGTPEGDPADLPSAPERRGDWSLGEPDQVIRMTEAFPPRRGRDIYRCFVLDTALTEDRFVSAIDILPGNRQAVHHVIVYLDESGEAEKKKEEDGLPGYNCLGGPGVPLVNTAGGVSSLLGFNATLGGWAPGSRPHHLPEGIGMRLRKNARIVLQIHYYTNVSVEPDQTRLGIYYSSKPVTKSLYFLPMAHTRLEIPAGAKQHRVQWDFLVPPFLDAQAISVFPHMHLLGTRVRAEAEFFGRTTPLILIDKWDFNWQGAYTYREPVSLPAFSRLRMTCEYDNSADNPRNPANPPKLVRWGEGTEDEMCVTFLGVTFQNENLLNSIFR
jgi:hypothetical protein